MLPISDTSIPRLAPKARVKWDRIRRRYLLLFPEGILVLNRTAQEIIAMCNGHHNVIMIVRTLSDKYKSQDIDPDVREMLNRLIERRLLLVSES